MNTTLTFGKHKGISIENVPTDYLEWGVENLDSPKWRKEFKNELSRRKQVENAKSDYIKENIDSPNVWERLLKESEKELFDEESESIITQKDVENLAKQKLAKYKSEIELNNLDSAFREKWGVTQTQINKLQTAYYCNELDRLCSTNEKYIAALELCQQRNKLICEING